MKSRISLFAAPVLSFMALGTLSSGCGSNDASQTDEWTGSSDSQLVCTGAGIHPASCGGFTPPPPAPLPEVVYSATTLPAPFAGCTAPGYFVESDRTTGGLIAESLYSLCPTGAAATAWVAASSSWSAKLSTAIPFSAGNGWRSAPAGQTYVEFTLPTPTSLPSQYSTQTPPVYFAESNIPVESGSSLPCTNMYFSVPNPAPMLGDPAPLVFTWVAYCAQTPDVDAFMAPLIAHCAVAGSTCTMAEGATAGEDDMPPAAPGYVYLSANMTYHHNVIGGGCKSGCFDY